MNVAPSAALNRIELQPVDEDQRRLFMGMVRIPNGALSFHDLDDIKWRLTFRNPDFDKAAARGEDTSKLTELIRAYSEDTHLWVPRYFRHPILDAMPWHYQAPTPQALPFSLKHRPRPHQLDVVSWLNSHSQDCGIRAGCGAGKTYMAFWNMARYSGQHLVIVHSQVKLKEWADAVREHTDVVERYGENAIGRIQGPVRRWEGCPIVIAMEHTVVKQDFPLELRNSFSTVTYDEVHRFTAPVMSRAFGKFNGQQLMLSATPGEGLRLDLLHLHMGGMWREASPDDKAQVEFQFIGVKMPPYFHKKEWRWQRNELGGGAGPAANAYLNVAYGLLCGLLSQGRRVMLVDGFINTLRGFYQHIAREKIGERTFQPGFVMGLDKIREIADESWFAEDYQKKAVGKTRPAQCEAFLDWSKREANPILGTGVSSTHPASTGMDITNLDGGVIMTPIGKADTIQQLLGRWERYHPTKQPPLVYVLYPNTETGTGLAHHMRSVLVKMGIKTNEVV